MQTRVVHSKNIYHHTLTHQHHFSTTITNNTGHDQNINSLYHSQMIKASHPTPPSVHLSIENLSRRRVHSPPSIHPSTAHLHNRHSQPEISPINQPPTHPTHANLKPAQIPPIRPYSNIPHIFKSGIHTYKRHPLLASLHSCLRQIAQPAKLPQSPRIQLVHQQSSQDGLLSGQNLGFHFPRRAADIELLHVVIPVVVIVEV